MVQSRDSYNATQIGLAYNTKNLYVRQLYMQRFFNDCIVIFEYRMRLRHSLPQRKLQFFTNDNFYDDFF